MQVVKLYVKMLHEPRLNDIIPLLQYSEKIVTEQAKFHQTYIKIIYQ